MAHGPVSSSERKVRVFGPVVKVATDLLAIGISDVLRRWAIRPKTVSGDLFGEPYRFIAVFRNLSAAGLSRVLVT